MENASERLQWLVYGCCDWAEEFRARQQESALAYLVSLLGPG